MHARSAEPAHVGHPSAPIQVAHELVTALRTKPKIFLTIFHEKKGQLPSIHTLRIAAELLSMGVWQAYTI